jgi:DnaJ-class molecular chaperone
VETARARDLSERCGRASAAGGFDGARREALSKLGLSEGADLAAIRRAFRELAAERHPDRFPHAGESQKTALMRQFAELTAAYHLLVA